MSATASPSLAGWNVQGVLALRPDSGCSHQPPVQITSEPAVAVQVADAQAVREPEGAGDGLARAARLADRVHLPGLRRVAAGREPGHLAFVVLALGLPAHDEHAVAVAEEVGVERRLVAGAVPDLVLAASSRPCPWGSRTRRQATPGKPMTIWSAQPSPLTSSVQQVMHSL